MYSLNITWASYTVIPLTVPTFYNKLSQNMQLGKHSIFIMTDFYKLVFKHKFFILLLLYNTTIYPQTFFKHFVIMFRKSVLIPFILHSCRKNRHISAQSVSETFVGVTKDIGVYVYWLKPKR